MSLRIQLMEAVIAALNAAGKPSTTPATRDLDEEAIDGQDLPRLNAYIVLDRPKTPADESRPGGRWSPVTERQLVIAVDLRVAGVAANAEGGVATLPSHKAADSHLDWISAALFGQTFGGLATQVEDGGTRFQYASAQQPYCLARTQVIVTYQQLENDATRAT